MITKHIDWSAHPSKGEVRMLSRYGRYGIYAGLDVGRFVHPSHLAVIVPVEREDEGVPQHQRHYVQVASVWLDGVPYMEQVEAIKEILAMGGKFVRLYYDATRGELEALREQGLLPSWWRGIAITHENKVQMAHRLLLALEQGRLRLLPDERQRKSLLQVNALLEAEESGSEHGEAFMSLMLALEAARQPGWSMLEELIEPGITTIYLGHAR